MSPSAGTRRRRRARRAGQRVQWPPAPWADSPYPLERDPVADYDAVGRKQPHRLNFMHFARVIPGYAAQFTGRVPGSFYAQVDDAHVEVACPCGGAPRCELLVPTRCDCERVFVWTGADVRVSGGPT